MGSFSWTRADLTTKRSNLTYGDKYKILVPKEFGGGYIKDIYFDYGKVFALQEDDDFSHLKKFALDKDIGYFVYVDEHGAVKHFECEADLYGILAYWNGCQEMHYNFPTYPKTMVEILLFGKTDDYDNRDKGIDIGCYDIQVDNLKYPLKLVSSSYKGTYEDCEGRSYGDPNQGFGKYKWSHRDYEKIYKKLYDAESDIEPIKSEIQVSEKEERLSDIRSSISKIESLAEKYEDDDLTHDILLDMVKNMSVIRDIISELL